MAADADHARLPQAWASARRHLLGVMRSLFLTGPQSQWLKERIPRYSFVWRAVSRFMPGATVEDALHIVPCDV